VIDVHGRIIGRDICRVAPDNRAMTWARIIAVVAGAGLVVCACSSSPSSSAGTDPVQAYLGAVNALCDALQAKVIAVTHGGSLDVRVQDYLAQQPAHAKLLADFDRQLALVPVPPAAKDKAAAMTAYINFADQLDAKRLAAARAGQAAYAKEIQSEATVESDPTIAARNAAGFSPSCDAR
jgi:hypothetical protein